VAGEAVDWPSVIKVLVLSRFYRPSSELHIAEHLYEHSALEDFVGIPSAQIYDNRLYRCLDKLLPHKEGLHVYLKERIGDLFGIKYDLFLYDVTSTYFEGEIEGSALCQRGYSRDGRPDCKQVCIALVVTKEGLPLGYEVFAGNRHDSTTVEEVVEKMEARYGSADRIWVMDRGMVSESNLSLLRSGGRRYIIGTPKASLKSFEQYLTATDWQVVRTGVEVKICPSPAGTEEVFILCKSQDRMLKEQAMHGRFIGRIEQGLETLRQACERSPGKDRTKVIERRVGRLLEKNNRGLAFFAITTQYDPATAKTVIRVEKNDDASQWRVFRRDRPLVPI
jgi:transposase